MKASLAQARELLAAQDPVLFPATPDGTIPMTQESKMACGLRVGLCSTTRLLEGLGPDQASVSSSVTRTVTELAGREDAAVGEDVKAPLTPLVASSVTP